MKLIIYTYLYFKYFFIKIISIFVKKNSFWIIQERGDDARDNGYYFYKYMINEQPQKKVYYVITKESPDYNKIRREDVLIYGSFKHSIMVFKSQVILSAHFPYSGLKGAPNIFKKALFMKHKSVFLQHGITKDYIPSITKHNGYDIDMFICGAKPEYDYVLKEYGFDKKVVKYTGFSRFDRLHDIKHENQILIMPTWRKSLDKLKYSEFIKTEYFIKWNNILNNAIWKKFIKKNIDVVFYPHPNLQKRITLFDNNHNIIFAKKDEYDLSDLIKKSKLLLTDYTSVFFDFAYMNKPIIYYQFDYEYFRNTHHQKGYFDYNSDGFGPVLSDENMLLNKLEEFIENNFKINKKYKERIEGFFILFDKNNSERIYHEVIKLIDNKKRS